MNQDILNKDARITELWVYPVKSLRGIAVDNWPITNQGLAFDRHWMLVMPNGRFVTQRQIPEMALIDTALELDQGNQYLRLSRPGMGSVQIPLEPQTRTHLEAEIWRDSAPVVEACEEASQWLTEVLESKQPLKLVQMQANLQRSQSQPERFGADTRVQFADAAPVLVANQASLDAFNAHLQGKQADAVDMRRFRPNIVIEGLPAFAEHDLNGLTMGELNLKLIDHCERCIITTIHPDTAEKDANMETYRLLVEINPMPEKPRAPAFGVNATIDLADGVSQQISIGR